VKRIKLLELVCIEEDSPPTCDYYVTWQDNTFEIFYHDDYANQKRVMRQYIKQAQENSKR